MENDRLTQIWDSQKSEIALENPANIIKKAKKQRAGQFITITVLSVTVLVLIAYAIAFIGSSWNNFALGLMLMISSLTFRIILEIITIYRKEYLLISLDNQAFQGYLKKYYSMRLRINYAITPICFGIYVYGFTLLLPYFKSAFSEGFYTYIVISGIVSLLVIAAIVINSILKEHRFLRELSGNQSANGVAE